MTNPVSAAAARAADRSAVSGYPASNATNAGITTSSAPRSKGGSGPDATDGTTERAVFAGYLRPGGAVAARSADAGPSDGSRQSGRPAGPAAPSRVSAGGAHGVAPMDHARFHEMLQGGAERPQGLDAGTMGRARRAYLTDGATEVAPLSPPPFSAATDVAAARRPSNPAPESDQSRLFVDGARGGISFRRGAAPGFAPDAAAVPTTIEPKIEAQMGQRGWTRQAIEDLIARPDRTVPTRHSRFDQTQGKRLDDPAMGYAARDGSYVVRNERTGAVVQVSDKREPGWKAPW